MLCDICHKNIATVHLTEIVNDNVVEMHICQSCAHSKAQELNEHLNVSDFLSGLIGYQEGKLDKRLLKCLSCGFTYEQFRKKGRLGCGRCYGTFRQQLVPLLKKIHSSTRHAGKVPQRADKKISKEVTVKELRARLEKAIKLEEYEEAAELRDKIKKLEKGV